MAVLTDRPGVPPGLPVWSDYTRFLRRYRTLLAALMALGFLAGFGWSLMQPASYSATASVVLTPVPVYVSSSTDELVPPEVTIDTDAQLLQSPRVRDAVGHVLGMDTEAAGEQLGVTASPSTHVLHITVQADTPSDAADAANAAVAAFVDVRRDALGSLRSEQLLQLRLMITEHEDELAKQQAQRLVVPSTDELFAQIQDLRTSLEELEDARHQPGDVVRPAVSPKNADYANTEVPVVSGVMLGLLAGCLIGAGRDRLRQLRDRTQTTHADEHPSGSEPEFATLPEEYDHAN